MRRMALMMAAVGGLAVFSTSATPAQASDWFFHGALHDQLEHRGFHRYQAHRSAHRYPMSYYGHSRLHDSLQHGAYHDRLTHRSYHRPFRSLFSFGYSGSRGGIGFGRSRYGSSFSFGFGH